MVAMPLMASSAFAQQQSLPSGAEPGRETLKPVMPMPYESGRPIAVPGAPAVEAPEGSENYRFTLSAVQISGATAFSQDELRALYAGLIGKQVSVRDMFGVANALEVKYRSAGYVTTRVLVPEQQVENGVFRITVVEASSPTSSMPTTSGRRAMPSPACWSRCAASARSASPRSNAACCWQTIFPA